MADLDLDPEIAALLSNSENSEETISIEDITNIPDSSLTITKKNLIKGLEDHGPLIRSIHEVDLSKTEFEGINLPKDLVDYFESDDRLIINWVSGPNTKAMKKVFPILNYLKDDDIEATDKVLPAAL